MNRRRILVVEDDAAIRQVLLDALELEGYDTVAAADYGEALTHGRRIPCDLALLDLVLPGGDGFDLLVELRQSWPSLPVIVLTARGREEDRVRGLKQGADDYVVKPFSIKEILARIEAVLRRSAERPTPLGQATFAGGTADFDSRRIRYRDGGHVDLSEREASLLRYLAENAGRPISRAELLSRVWHLSPNRVRTRTIDMHVARLREKLRDSGGNAAVIVTERGKGYRFNGGHQAP